MYGTNLVTIVSSFIGLFSLKSSSLIKIISIFIGFFEIFSILLYYKIVGSD
ncbi:hypothetical protein IMSAGC022_01343 [Alistipes sp.]|nr:hypothetical protein IMSAGC022_01343 [Alistipes sp.]